MKIFAALLALFPRRKSAFRRMLDDHKWREAVAQWIASGRQGPAPKPTSRAEAFAEGVRIDWSGNFPATLWPW